MTGNREHLPARIAKAILRWGALATGLIVSWRAAGWTGVGAGVDRVSIWYEYTPNDVPPTPGKWALTGLCVVSIILLTGASRWRVGRVNLGQILGAAWMGLWTAFWAHLVFGAQFFGDDPVPCIRQDCWPAGIQEPLAASPLLIACVAMIVVACFTHRLNWTTRALIPTTIYLALRITQILIWEPVVIPYLVGN